jgi:acetolactate synthase-1/2/3 large subunit
MGTSTGGELVVEALVDAGVTHVVGMSGHTTLPVLDALHQTPSIRFVLAKHEQTVGAMADGYARFTGRPGVCLVHVGPSAANLVIGVATAYRESSPVIALTCNEQLALLDRDVFNAWDQLTPFSRITKWSARAHRAADIPRLMRAAIVRASLGRPGPVQVDLPLDVLRDEVEAPNEKRPAYPCYSSRARPAPDLLERIVRALSQAERPVLVAGDGLAADASMELIELAERLPAPVLVTMDGRGAIPEDHPLFAGLVGVWGHAAASDAMRTADLILGVGCRFTDTETLTWSLIPREATVIQVDADPASIARHYPVDLGLVADAQRFLQDLLAMLARGTEHAGRAQRVRELRNGLELERQQYFSARPDNAPLRHEHVIRDVTAWMDKDALVTVGAGRHSLHASKLVITRPRSFVKSSGFGQMGFAFPAALGAKLAFPDRQVWCFTGDGDFSMVMQDLETAVREKLNVITVVFNDSSYSSVKQLQRSRYGDRPIGVDYLRTDFAGFAELCGAHGARVAKPGELGPALASAVAGGRPALIDVAVEPI